MVQEARVALQKALKNLEFQKTTIEREAKAIRSALEALGAKSPQLAGRRKRKPMTSAERKSVSRRMKAYWARKRAQ